MIIFGSSGFIGSELTKNANTISLRRKDFDLKIRSELPIKLKKDDIVVYAAGIPRSKSNKLQDKRDNLTMVQNFITSLRGCLFKKIIFLSSVEVYGEAPEIPITEDTKLSPFNHYSEGKLEAEKLLKEFSQKVTILRLPGIYGLNSSGGFLRIALQKHFSKEKLVLEGEGKVKRDFVDVKDLSRLVQTLREKDEVVPLLNVARGESLSLLEYCNILNITQIEKNISEIKQFDLIFDNKLLRDEVPNYKFSDIKKSLISLKESYS